MKREYLSIWLILMLIVACGCSREDYTERAKASDKIDNEIKHLRIYADISKIEEIKD